MQLLEQIKSLRGAETIEVINAIGAVSPHAGYDYSGHVAALTIASIKPKHNYIIIGPNHTGAGSEFGMSSCEAWRTPLGQARINDALAESIAANSPLITREDLSSAGEHSIEVQLPILQALTPGEFSFVPIVASYANSSAYGALGRAIASAINSLKLENDTVIIASSDMTHGEPVDAAKRKDKLAIDAILELDGNKLIDTVTRHNITMCGFAPAAIMLSAAKELGAKKATLVGYQTSGDSTGDYTSVVGYAGIVIS